jgi:hypothetical protein
MDVGVEAAPSKASMHMELPSEYCGHYVVLFSISSFTWKQHTRPVYNSINSVLLGSEIAVRPRFRSHRCLEPLLVR